MELGRDGDRLLGIEGHDAYTYFDPIDNLLQNGEYAPDYRLPGFLPLYLPLRLFADRIMAWNILLVAQLLLSAVSTWLLARTALLATGSRVMFLLVFFGYALASYVSVFDITVLSESFATSFLIIGFYFLARYRHKPKATDLLLSGAFITWVVFLKPAFVLVFVLALALMLFRAVSDRIPFRRVALQALLLLLPFLVLDGLWIARNHQKYHGFYPFSRTLYYPAYYTSVSYPVCEYVTGIGGSFAWWQPSAEIRWFGKGTREIFADRQPDELPAYIYTEDYNRDSLLVIREKFTRLIYHETPHATRARDSLYLFARLPLYLESFRSHKPFHYYVVAPLRLAKRFLFHSGTYNLFARSFPELNWPEKLLKLFYSVFYITTVLLGLTGVFLSVVRFRRNTFITIACAGMVIYSIVLFPMVLRLDEFRYFVPSYPFLIICAAFAVMQGLRIFDPNLDR